MNIGLIIYGSLNQRSGGYLYDRYLVAQLRRRKHHVHIISLPWRNYLAHISDNWSPALLQTLRAKKLDLLLQDELNHPSLFAFNARIRRELGLPIISIVHHLRSSEHHLGVLNALYRAVERRYLRSVDGFIFNSNTTRRAVRGLLSALPPHVVAQPGGDRLRPRAPVSFLRRRAMQPGPLRVLFLGSLMRRKAPHLLLEAVRMLPKGSIRVQLTGGDAEAGYARSLRQQAAGLGGAVRFSGHLAEPALRRALRSSHVLALPSSYEGYGIAYLEGMGFGLPPIGTRAGAAGELFTHGREGFLINPGDADALARGLLRLHTDRGLLLRLSLAAQRRYAQHPTWRSSMGRAAEFLSLYNRHTIQPRNPSRRKRD